MISHAVLLLSSTLRWGRFSFGSLAEAPSAVTASAPARTRPSAAISRRTSPHLTRTRPPSYVSTALAAATSPRCSLPSTPLQTSARREQLYGSTKGCTSKALKLASGFNIQSQRARASQLFCIVCFSEKVTIPAAKQNITFQGQGFTTTAIAWNDTARTANGTFYSASVAIFGVSFIAKNISFMVCSSSQNCDCSSRKMAHCCALCVVSELSSHSPAW